MKVVLQKHHGWILALMGLLVFNPVAVSADTNAPTRSAEAPADNDSLRAYLALQEQVRATQMALEKNRQETEAVAVRSAEAIAQQIKTLTQAMSEQRAREVEAMQSTNRLMFIVVGVFACLGFLAMLMTSWLQMRALNRLTEFSSALPLRGGLPGVNLGGSLISNAVAAQANSQLFGALDRIERRMNELEHGVEAPAKPAEATAAPTPAPGEPAAPGPASGTNGTTPHPDQISLLLAKGQSLLSLDQAVDALQCFDAILSLNPNHAEALVKKGAALELLRRDEEALRCYDRAIAADDSLTIAYLQKGGLFNRLERYEEALVCYERALQTQDRAKQ
jgi:tetratricopeptide (TPR) repeat protein